MCELLGCPEHPRNPHARNEVLHYELAEPCGALFSMTHCSFGVEVEDDRVAAAWLHDTDGPPWSIECLYGCERSDMQARMRPEPSR